MYYAQDAHGYTKACTKLKNARKNQVFFRALKSAVNIQKNLSDRGQNHLPLIHEGIISDNVAKCNMFAKKNLVKIQIIRDYSHFSQKNGV